MTPDRTPSPIPVTDGKYRLKRGVVYQLFTGIAIEGITRPWQLYCEALPELWKEGLVIDRVVVEPEISFFVRTMGEAVINLREAAVSVEVVNTHFSLDRASVEVQTGETLAPVGFSPAPVAGGERVVKGMSQEIIGTKTAATDDAAAEARAKAWLDEDDGKGKVVSADTALASDPVAAAAAALPVDDNGVQRRPASVLEFTSGNG